MCGIAGIWEGTGIRGKSERVTKMLKSIRHRGPDGSQVWEGQGGNMVIGHNRLAILDLSNAGSQPMVSHSGRYVIAYNGEIYNHRALRRDIDLVRSGGIKWKSSCDTETLLEAIEEWGVEKAIRRCTGMFAFALWDKKEQSLTLVRDRFGEKPMYWGWVEVDDGRVLVFASDLRGIVEGCGKESLVIDEIALQGYFSNGYIEGPRTIYRGLEQLGPGEYIVFRDWNSVHEKRYWWYWREEKERQSYAIQNRKLVDDVEELEGVISTAVEGCMEADVAAGCFLSGGIDSTLIATILSKKVSRLTTLTVSFPESREYNEGHKAQYIAEQLGTNHIEIAISQEDMLRSVMEMPEVYSEPFADMSQIPTALISKKAKENGLSVVLTGDGGDELFGGYRRHISLPRIKQACEWMPALVRRNIRELCRHGMSVGSERRRQDIKRMADVIYHASSLVDARKAVSKVWDREDGVLKGSWSVVDKEIREQRMNVREMREFLMEYDLENYLPNDILTKVDRAGMWYSLETRAPFLDHRIAEYAWRLPMERKVQGGIGKVILRELVKRDLGVNIASGAKRGFSVPVDEWLRGPLRGYAEEILNRSYLREQGYLDEKLIARMWDEQKKGRSHGAKLWSVLMFQGWLLRYR